MKLAFLFLISFALTTSQPDEPIDIPVVRPGTDFYGGAGLGVKIYFEIDRSRIPVGEWFQLRLIVEGLLNPEQAMIPDLRMIADFHDAFEIRDPKEIQPQIEANRWIVTYSIRARSESIQAIPPLKYRYYNPRANTSRLNLDFPTTQSPSLPIQIESMVRPPPPKEPLFVPDGWDDPIVQSNVAGSSISWNQWFAIAVFVPIILLLVFFALIRGLLPSERRRIHRMRSRAGRIAIQRLQRLENRTDWAEQIHSILWDYLNRRFTNNPSDRSLASIEHAFQDQGIPANRLEPLRMFLQKLDAIRFAPTPTSASLVLEGIQLITHLEEAHG